MDELIDDLKTMAYLSYVGGMYFDFITTMLLDERIEKEIRIEYLDKLHELTKLKGQKLEEIKAKGE